jgi:serine/threonine protein kinase/tetratricopeptide (TPR) repeat protein
MVPPPQMQARGFEQPASLQHGFDSFDPAMRLGAMTPELWNRLSPLFSAAIDLPVAERRAFAAQACGDNAELHRELLNLIDAHERQVSVTGAIASEIETLSGHEALRILEPGDILLDRYKIISLLGSGGMGDVYKAHDMVRGRDVALKRIRPEIVRNDAILARFIREVNIALELDGPNLCRIYDLSQLKDSRGETYDAFLTMEFLDGATLADRLRAGPLPWPEAQAIALDICAGLGTMHRKGIVHRDVKSRNIMLAKRDDSSRAVLMDFGLARQLSEPGPSAETGLTMPGVPMGTIAYMAPEQFEGEIVTPAADIYAMGIVLYELVTGKNPFAGSNVVEAAILRDLKPDDASTIAHRLPSRWDRIIRKCIHFDPAQRYQSADELARALKSGPLDLLRLLWKSGASSLASLTAIVLMVTASWFIPSVREKVQGLVFAEREKHIVVLPFDVSVSGPDGGLLADGLMDSLTGKLSNLNAEDKDLWVVPASEVRRRKVGDPSSAYREFGATMVVKGRFSQNGKTVRLYLELIDSRRVREIGYADVQNPEQDLSALQNDAVVSLGRLMNVPTPSQAQPQQEAGVSSSAYQEYIAALGYLGRFDKPGNLDGAIASLNRAVAASPNFSLALSQLCHAYTLKYQIELNPGTLNDAQHACDKAIAVDNRIPTTYAALASLHRITGKKDQAAQEYQQVIDLEPNNVAALQGMGHIYEKEGRFQDAEHAFRRAAELRPKDWDGFSELGNFYDRNGHHREAIAPLQHALKLTPDNSIVLCNLGNVYLNSNDPALFSEAEKAYRESIAISPTYQAYAGLGTLYGQEQKFEQAASETRNALDLDDQDYAVWTNLMQAYEGIPNLEKAAAARDQAITRAERALATNANNADPHAELALLLARKGYRDSAQEHIRAALAMAPKDLNVLAEVADAYEVLGDRTQAIHHLELAISNGFPVQQINGDSVLKKVSADPRFRRKTR